MNNEFNPKMRMKDLNTYLLANVLLSGPEKLEMNLNELYKKEKFFELLRNNVTKKCDRAVTTVTIRDAE